MLLTRVAPVSNGLAFYELNAWQMSPPAPQFNMFMFGIPHPCVAATPRAPPTERSTVANGGSVLGSEGGEHDFRCFPDQGELRDSSSSDFSTILRWTTDVASTG